MHPSIRNQLFAATCVIAASDVCAQSRGEGCRGGLCAFTGTAVIFVLFGLLVASVYGSIKRKGLIKGVLGHTGVQIIFGYMTMLLVITGIPVLLDFYLGKTAAMWGLGGMLVICFLALSWLSSRPPSPSSKNKLKGDKQV